MDSPQLNEGPHFINNKSLAAICWQGLLKHSAHQEEPHIDCLLPALCPACLCPLSEQLQEKPVFCQRPEARPFQSELHNLYKQTENLGGNFSYKI